MAQHSKNCGKTSYRNINAAEKRRKAFELRLLGTSYEDIAKEVGYKNGRSAYAAVNNELMRRNKYTSENLEKIRELELKRLDKLQEAMIKQAIANNDNKAGLVALKCLESRRRLLGLDAPAKTETKIDVSSMTDEELRAQLAQALQEISEPALTGGEQAACPEDEKAEDK